MSGYDPYLGGGGAGSGYGSTHHSMIQPSGSPLGVGSAYHPATTGTQISCAEGSTAAPCNSGWFDNTCASDASPCSSMPATRVSQVPPPQQQYNFSYQPPSNMPPPRPRKSNKVPDCIRQPKYKCRPSSAFASRTERLIFNAPAHGGVRTEKSRLGPASKSLQGIYAPGPDKYGMAQSVREKHRYQRGASAGFAPPAAKAPPHKPYRPPERALNLYATDMADPRSFSRRMAQLANK